MGLTNSQYNRLMQEYDRRRLTAHEERERRKAALYEKLPEYRILDAKTGSLYARLTTAKLSGDETAIGAAEAAIQRNTLQKNALLSEHGYDESALAMHYTCADCRDTGYIGRERCHCLIQASVALLYEQSGIAERLEKENFNTFRLDYYADDIVDPATGTGARTNAQEVYRYALDYTAHFADSAKGGNILLYGSTGTGKTFLTHCIAKALIDQGFSVICMSSVRLFDTMADTHFGRSGEGEGTHYVTEDFLQCDLLIIDDLGTEIVNNFSISAFFELINERSLTSKSTIISANLGPEDMMKLYTERIFSRLAKDYRMFKLYGSDIRMTHT